MNKWEKLNDNYLQYGLKIFPVVQNGKTPLIREWQKDCSSEYMQVLYWYENAKDCNWGMPATPNNLFVIDLDRHDPNKDGVVNFNKLLRDIECYDCRTLEQETPSGGCHLIFKSNEILKSVPNSSNIFIDYPGIDCRSDGYIVIDPSTINGKQYHMCSKLDSLEPQEMPLKLQEYIINNVGTKKENKKTPYEKPKEVFKGDRDNQLFNYINYLYFKTTLDKDEILTLAKHFNEEVLEEPFSEKDVRYKVKKSFEKNRGNFLIVRLPDDE